MSWSSAEGTGRAARTRPGARVVRAIDEWRVATRWWTSELRRNYYLVELEGGRLVELYSEGEHWWVAGMAD